MNDVNPIKSEELIAFNLKLEKILGEKLNNFRGEWVAVNNYEIIDTNPQLNLLVETIQSHSSSEDYTIFKVPLESISIYIKHFCYNE